MSECFAREFSKSVGSLSEKELIRRFCGALKPCMPPSPEGAGDDCAVLPKGNFPLENILSTSDAVILGRHFLPETSAFDAGRKLLNRNASDIASMGGVPVYAMTSSIISPKISIEWIEDFARGLKFAAQKIGVKFVGGDVARGDGGFFSMHLTLLGAVQKPLLRSGAKCGDRIFVTGALGASFESGRHLTFEPRLKEGLFLAKCANVSACTDLSDGLASDIFDILADGESAEIFADKIPVFDFVGNSLKKSLCDGEDYELLFTMSDMSDFEADAFISKFKVATSTEISEIGRIVSSAGEKSKLYLIDAWGVKTEFKDVGFSHF